MAAVRRTVDRDEVAVFILQCAVGFLALSAYVGLWIALGSWFADSDANRFGVALTGVVVTPCIAAVGWALIYVWRRR